MMQTEAKVLDAGRVRLVTWTHWNMPELANQVRTAREYLDKDMPAYVAESLATAAALLASEDLAAVNAARASFDKESQALEPKDLRLLRFLAQAEPVPHMAPFRHAHVTLEVYAPLFVCRQWWKHVVGAPLEEGTPWSELSRRYVRGEIEYHLPLPWEWRAAPDNAKQGSGGPLVDTDTVAAAAASTSTKLALDALVRHYHHLLELGVAAEQARMVLPQNVYTTFRWSPSVQALANFLVQRLDDHAQHEIRLYARALVPMVAGIFPHSLEALLVES